MEQAFIQQALHQRSEASDANEFGHDILAARLEIRQHRYALADAREVVERERDASRARDREQVARARKLIDERQGKVKVILTGGSYLELMRHWKRPVFYDQQGQLTDQLGIRHVPALVTQEGRRLRIDEIQYHPSLSASDIPAGATGLYFKTLSGDDTEFNALRNDAAINFNWGSAAPHPAVAATPYEIRWDGWLVAPVTGTYRLQLAITGKAMKKAARRPTRSSASSPRRASIRSSWRGRRRSSAR